MRYAVRVCLYSGGGCDIRGGGPRPQNVLIYNFPYKIGHDVVKTALSYFGDVEYVRFRHWTHLVDVCDGVRTVRMVCTRAIPSNLIIDGFPVKVLYVGHEPECDTCGKKGHIARTCDMRGKCMECKQPGHFQRNCPVRRCRLSNPDLELHKNSESVDPVPGTPESASAVVASVPVDSAPAVPVSGVLNGAGPLEDDADPVIEDGASSQAVSQLILADVSGPRSGPPSVLSESVDSRDNQLNELVSSGSIGVGTNCSDSFFGAVVSTPNSNLSVEAGEHPPNSNLIVVNESSDNVNSELHKNGNNDISNDIVNSELNMNDDNVSDMELQMQSNNDISSVDNDDDNDNKYETSSEGLSSDGEISEDESELEAGDTPPSVSHGNFVSPSSSDLSAPFEQCRKGPVSVTKAGGAGTHDSSSGAKVPSVSGVGVQKSGASRSSGISEGLRRAASDWSSLAKRRK